MIKKQLPWDFPAIGENIAKNNKNLQFIAFWIDEKNKYVEYYFFHLKDSYKIYKTKILLKELGKL